MLSNVFVLVSENPVVELLVVGISVAFEKNDVPLVKGVDEETSEELLKFTFPSIISLGQPISATRNFFEVPLFNGSRIFKELFDVVL